MVPWDAGARRAIDGPVPRAACAASSATGRDHTLIARRSCFCDARFGQGIHRWRKGDHVSGDGDDNQGNAGLRTVRDMLVARAW